MFKFQEYSATVTKSLHSQTLHPNANLSFFSVAYFGMLPAQPTTVLGCKSILLRLLRAESQGRIWPLPCFRAWRRSALAVHSESLGFPSRALRNKKRRGRNKLFKLRSVQYGSWSSAKKLLESVAWPTTARCIAIELEPLCSTGDIPKQYNSQAKSEIVCDAQYPKRCSCHDGQWSELIYRGDVKRDHSLSS